VTDATTPCLDRKTDPNDWFIRPDGKQYSDDDFLTQGERRGVARSVIPISGETYEEHEARVRAALSAAIGGRKRAALIRRRKAKEACFGCEIRDTCLEQAIERSETHGTWGGLLEEELDEVRKEQARRRRRRALRHA